MRATIHDVMNDGLLKIILQTLMITKTSENIKEFDGFLNLT